MSKTIVDLASWAIGHNFCTRLWEGWGRIQERTKEIRKVWVCVWW